MDLGFREHLRWDFGVLTRLTLNQVHNIVDAAVFQSELLFLIPPINYRCCEIVCSFSLYNEVKHIVNVLSEGRLGLFLGFFRTLFPLGSRFILYALFILLATHWCLLSHSKDPDEVTQG